MQIDEIATLTKLHTIILTKKWNIVKEEHERMFQDFCVRLMALTQEQQSLVLDLSENFDYFTLDTYDSMIAEITRTISKTISESAKIYLLPIKDKSKAGVTKSSDAVMYPLKTHLIRNHKFNTKNIHAFENPELIKQYHSGRTDSVIIFVDDFLGSGDSAKKSIEYFEKNLMVKDDKILVVSLIAQEQGVLNIMDLGYEVYSADIRKKGISDKYDPDKATEYLALMKQIEETLGIPTEYSLGYSQSEALVSMSRIPNNTFPFFWFPTGKGSKQKLAPFVRY